MSVKKHYLINKRAVHAAVVQKECRVMVGHFDGEMTEAKVYPGEWVVQGYRRRVVLDDVAFKLLTTELNDVAEQKYRASDFRDE